MERNLPRPYEAESTVQEFDREQHPKDEPSGKSQMVIRTESADPQLVDRVRAEYEEMPGMSLTLDQVVRLCGVERSMCRRVLDALVAAKFLSLKPNGTFARRIDEPVRIRMATSHLRDFERPPIRRRAG
jgi:hypothetical protein